MNLLPISFFFKIKRLTWFFVCATGVHEISLRLKSWITPPESALTAVPSAVNLGNNIVDSFSQLLFGWWIFLASIKAAHAKF